MEDGKAVYLGLETTNKNGSNKQGKPNNDHSNDSHCNICTVERIGGESVAFVWVHQLTFQMANQFQSLPFLSNNAAALLFLWHRCMLKISLNILTDHLFFAPFCSSS